MNKKKTKPVSTNLNWEETIIPTKEPGKCDHYFEFTSGVECKCKKCHMGLVGVVEIVDGKPV